MKVLSRWFVRAIVLCSVSCVFFANATETQTRTVEWTELMPVEQLSILMNPPEQLLAIAEGSAQDSIDALDAQDEAMTVYQQALSSGETIDEFNNKSIRIPGFVVPLDFNQNEEVTAFFLVPYFGACLHMPPPPPNQIIYVKSDFGISVENLSDPVWTEGTLTIANNENELGASAYELALTNFSMYEE